MQEEIKFIKFISLRVFERTTSVSKDVDGNESVIFFINTMHGAKGVYLGSSIACSNVFISSV